MTLLRAFVVHELKLRSRMPAFWLSVILYVVACVFPAVLIFLGRDETRQMIGANTYLTQVYRVQPLLTALLATVLAVNAINRERDEGSFAVVALTPMSSAGYLLRRWLALQAMLLPVTLLPVLGAAALGAASGAELASPVAFFAPWLLHIAPLALGCSALALGLGTITSGLLAALLLAAALFTFGLGLVNDVLALYGRHLGGPASWLGAENLAYGVGSYTVGVQSYYAPSTEGPYDLRAAAEIYLARGGPFLGLAALSLGLAARYLRRTRRNLRPWSIRESHPLRTFLKLANKMRAGAVPDPRPWAADRLVVVAGAALFLVTIAWSASRDGWFRREAGVRYETELAGDPDPTSKTVVPGDWKLSGEIDGAGLLRASLSAEMINRGSEPVGRLSFQLNPLLEISSLRADGAETRIARRVWDRLVLSVDPPLPPDRSLKLEMEITGAPGSPVFDLPRSGSFVEDYGRYRNARYANELHDLSRSWITRSVSARRIALDAQDLLPVPRYTPWTLTPPSEVLGREGKVVQPETFFPRAGLELRLEAPAGRFLADSCGHFSVVKDDTAVLSGACRLPLTRLAVRGGTMRPLDEASGVGALAVLASHRDAAELHLASLIEASEMARRAWPEADLFREIVVLEWPPAFDIDAAEGMWIPWGMNDGELEVEAVGRLLLLPESLLIQRTPLPPEPLAGAALAHALVSRRAIRDEETFFFEHFFRWLAAHRMGTIVQQCAIATPRAGYIREEMDQSILESGPWSYAVWSLKLPALMCYVERRAGSRAFLDGVRAFLAGGAEAGSARELLGEIGRHAGISLDRIYEDYLEGSALPELTLAGVESTRRGPDWTVTGEIVNAGKGETVCPLVLQTDVGSVSTEVVVSSAAATPFRLRSPHLPRTLLLDPDRRCFRLELKPKIDIVDRVELARSS